MHLCLLIKLHQLLQISYSDTNNLNAKLSHMIKMKYSFSKKVFIKISMYRDVMKDRIRKKFDA